MHMVWPGIDYTNVSYSPQTTNTAIFNAGLKGDTAEMTKEIELQRYAFAQHLTAMNFFPNGTYPPTVSSTSPSMQHISKKKAKPVPDSEKNQAYYERRSKNNESAKRSREERRRKEAEKELVIQSLTAERAKLIHEINVLKYQISCYQNQQLQMTTPTNPTTTPPFFQ